MVGLRYFKGSIHLRLSYSYFLNDFLKDKNTALMICYSCPQVEESTSKKMSFKEQYLLHKLKLVLESYENEEINLSASMNSRKQVAKM